MPSFSYEGLHYYYETHGDGTPLLLLNGIMMSTKSWTPFVAPLAARHRVILLDMLDQGQSSRASFSYTQAHQVQVILALLQHLKLSEVTVMGISYGGEVALQLAATSPRHVKKLLVFNTVGYTNSELKALGDQWNEVAASGDGEKYYEFTIPVIYSSTFKSTHAAWMAQRKKVLLPIFQNPAFLQAMMRLTDSADAHDIRWCSERITMPTLIVGSSEDTLTPFAWQDHLATIIPHAHLIRLEKVGHASMYEKPELFVSIVLGFTAEKPTIYQI